MLVNTGFYWSLGQIFNEIFNDFSSRPLSGTGTSRTRPLHGCGSKWGLISLQNESSGYDAAVSQIQTLLGNVVRVRQLEAAEPRRRTLNLIDRMCEEGLQSTGQYFVEFER